jgi:glycosyltransferase involved in cell wall biosynthesis
MGVEFGAAECGNVPSISVVLCTFNPSRDVLKRTLSALAAQTFTVDCWELILVDNNSDPPLSPVDFLGFHPNSRCIREPKQGKVFALIKGICAAAAELIISVDDDSPLEPDYLEVAFRIHQSRPELGAFGAGTISPLYETEPPRWFAEVSGLLAIRTLSSPAISDAMTGSFFRPWGLGLCITRPVAQAWVSWCACNLGSLPAVSGRKATGLEDDLFSILAVWIGLRYGVFPELRIRHLIPSSRLGVGYLMAMARGHGYSHAQLSMICGLPLQNPDPPASLKVAIALLLGFRFRYARVEFSRLRSQFSEPLPVRQVRREKDSGWKEAIRDYQIHGLLPWKDGWEQPPDHAPG